MYVYVSALSLCLSLSLSVTHTHTALSSTLSSCALLVLCIHDSVTQSEGRSLIVYLVAERVGRQQSSVWHKLSNLS